MDNRDEVLLDAALLCNMSIGKLFRDSEEQLIGLEFSEDGSLLAAYSSSSLFLYDTSMAKKVKTLHNKLTRISLLRFTHSPTAVVFSGELAPFDVFYWSLYENEVLRVFRASAEHPCVCLQMNPTSDLLLAVDKSSFLRIFDLAGNGGEPLMVMDLAGKVDSARASFDRSGQQLVVAMSYADGEGQAINKAEFHELAGDNYKGKRLTTFFENLSPVESIKPDFEGKTMAFLMRSGNLLQVNISDGAVVKSIKSAISLKELVPEFSFTPDSKFILAGSEEGQVKVFEVESGAEIAKYSSHIKPVLAIKFSPTLALFASACQNVILWVPKLWDNAYN